MSGYLTTQELAHSKVETLSTSRFLYFFFVEVAPAELCDSPRAKPCLPDPAGLLADHRVSLFAAKGLGKPFHVGERAVAAKTRERVRVGVGLQTRCPRPLMRTPHLGPSEEEALL